MLLEAETGQNLDGLCLSFGGFDHLESFDDLLQTLVVLLLLPVLLKVFGVHLLLLV